MHRIGSWLFHLTQRAQKKILINRWKGLWAHLKSLKDPMLKILGLTLDHWFSRLLQKVPKAEVTWRWMQINFLKIRCLGSAQLHLKNRMKIWKYLVRSMYRIRWSTIWAPASSCGNLDLSRIDQRANNSTIFHIHI